MGAGRAAAAARGREGVGAHPVALRAADAEGDLLSLQVEVEVRAALNDVAVRLEHVVEHLNPT